jgi:hypothetical protein
MTSLRIDVLLDPEGSVSLRGPDTYKVRGLIKAKGARWNPAEQKWTMPSTFDDAGTRAFLREVESMQESDPKAVVDANDIFSPKKQKQPDSNDGDKETAKKPKRPSKRPRKKKDTTPKGAKIILEGPSVGLAAVPIFDPFEGYPPIPDDYVE